MQRFETCVLCREKIFNSAAVPEYYSGSPAHVQCIEEKVCVFCGTSGLCIKCESKDCLRTLHQHCHDRYFPQSNGACCDIHRKGKGRRKEHHRLWLSRQIANKASQSPETVQQIKESQIDNKFLSICSGQVFWYCIGSQYFPNFISLRTPQVNTKVPVALSAPWHCNLENYTSQLTSELKNTRRKISELVKPAQLSPSSSSYREEDMILSETRDLSLREGFEEYVQYFEGKSRTENSLQTNTEKRISSLREFFKSDEDFVCWVCGDGDYEDDDLIVICSSCDMGAHMKCYGIPVVPENDWICDGCLCTTSLEARNSLKCALCPVKGGCLKPTTHSSDEHNFPNYSLKVVEQVWCHVFCASHLNFNVFGDKENLSCINLLEIDAKRFSLKCSVCNTKDGACLQCQHGRCQTAFHPECGKCYFTNTRDKSGHDEVNYFCLLHKPLKLRRMLEAKEKKTVEDVVRFCKAFERRERKEKKAERVLGAGERGEEIEDAGEKVPRDMEFEVADKKRHEGKRIQLSLPKNCSLLESEVLKHKIKIKGRKDMEYYKIDSDSLLAASEKKSKMMHAQKSPAGLQARSQKAMKSVVAKRKEKNTPKIKIVQEPTYLSADIDNDLLYDVVSKELYCICRQPFVEKSVKKPFESEEEFIKRSEETKMIQCEICDEWFHYKCVGLQLCMEYTDDYICAKCDKSRSKLG